MKRTLTALSVICTLLITSCIGGQQQQENDNSEVDSLQDIINQKDDELNELMSSFADIQDGFSRITDAEGRINTLSSSEGEKPEVAQNIQENMEYIAEIMQENRERIAQLQAKLNASTIKSGKLKEQIEKLQAQYEEKVKEIADLKIQLANKEIEIKALSDTIVSLATENSAAKAELDAKEQVMNNQDAQLNTAYYVYGTKKELKEHNILDGKDVMKGSFDKSYFTKIDIREFHSVKLDSKSASLLTSHPEGSYTLVKDSDGTYFLSITDAAKFWSVSKYLVILVK